MEKRECRMRHLWNWWSNILLATWVMVRPRGGVGVVFFTGVGAEVVEVLGCC